MSTINKNNITLQIRQKISEVSAKPLDDISLTSSLEDDLGLDSLDLAAMGLDLEEALGIEIDPEVYFSTVGDVVDFVMNIIQKDTQKVR